MILFFFTYKGWCEPSLTVSDGGHCLLGGREGGVSRFTAPPRRGRQTVSLCYDANRLGFVGARKLAGIPL